MNRTNLARLEPTPHAVLSVADPAKVVTTTGEVLGALDLDHLCNLLIRSERSLSLVNRRAFSAALADVPAIPNQALRPAPPFAEAVAAAREDGKLLERTRLFLAQNPRALEELTPELTIALLRHFDPSMRMRPSVLSRSFVALGIAGALAAAIVLLTSQHFHSPAHLASQAAPKAQAYQHAALPNQNIAHHSAPPVTQRARYENEVAVIPRATVATARVPVAPAVSLVQPASQAPVAVVHPVAQHFHHRWHRHAALLPTQLHPQNVQSVTVAKAAPPVNPLQTNANATALVLRSIVAQEPDSTVEWIRASKTSDRVITVTARVAHNGTVAKQSYRLWNTNGQLTVLGHSQ